MEHVEESIQINVRGTLFRMNKTKLQKYPDTLLGSMFSESDYYDKQEDCFYFDRNPDLFNTILDYYINDEIHLPTNICGWLWKSELEFWKIPKSKIAECCFPIYSQYQDNKIVSDKLRAVFAADRSTVEVSTTHLGHLKNQIWLFLDDPASSIPARVYSVVYLSLVLLYSLLPCIATHPDIRVEQVNATTLAWYAYYYNIDLWVDFNNPKEVMIVTTDIPSWLYHLELVLGVFFTVEFLLRFITSPFKLKFFLEWLNLLDIILLVGFWISFGLSENHQQTLLENFTLSCFQFITECLSVLRLLRLCRVARQYSSLRILFLAVQASVKELLLLLVTFLALAYIFANLIYYAEIREVDTFPNMLDGVWWAVVTMTTVGYGDMYPTGTAGRIVGAICTMCGLLVIALPIAVIAGNFSDIYKKNVDRETFNKLQQLNITNVTKMNTVAPNQNGTQDFEKTLPPIKHVKSYQTQASDHFKLATNKAICLKNKN